MARYRFHCTNGLECVFDATGDNIRAAGRLTRRADARTVMHSLSDRVDWSDWHVSVQELKGQRVLVQPFVPRAEHLARAA